MGVRVHCTMYNIICTEADRNKIYYKNMHLCRFHINNKNDSFTNCF